TPYGAHRRQADTRRETSPQKCHKRSTGRPAVRARNALQLAASRGGGVDGVPRRQVSAGRIPTPNDGTGASRRRPGLETFEVGRGVDVDEEDRVDDELGDVQFVVGAVEGERALREAAL